MYEFESTFLPGVFVITPARFNDDRGYLFESFNKAELKKIIGIDFDISQENSILNVKKGVIRGLHFQKGPFEQVKIVRCTLGEVDDVAVDIRKGSQTYGKWFMTRLTAENRNQLVIPKGFAHGVISRTEVSAISYISDIPWHPEADMSIRYDDPTINIDWKEDNPVLSEKDLKAPFLSEIQFDFER